MGPFEFTTRKAASHAAFLCEWTDRLKGRAASCLLVSIENQSITFDSSNNAPPKNKNTPLFFFHYQRNGALLALFFFFVAKYI